MSTVVPAAPGAGGYHAGVASPPAMPAAVRAGIAARQVDGASLAPWIAAAIVLAVGLLALDRYPVGAMQDDAMYVILAKAIAGGEGLRWIQLPGAPEATHFPPGYPLLLAFLWKLWPDFPANVMLFKVANAVLIAAAAALLVRLAVERFGFSPRGAAAVAVLSCIATPTLVLSTVVMSEPLFLALAIWALLRLERLAAAPPEGPAARADSLHSAAATGVLIGVAMLVRTHGIALLAAAVLVLALRRRPREALALGSVAAVLVLPWQLWVAAYDGLLPVAMRGNFGSYTGWLLEGIRQDGPVLLARALSKNVVEITTMMLSLFGAGMPAVVVAVMFVALAAMLAIGGRVLWRQAPVAALFLVAYLSIVLLWPFSPTRFVWAVWPLVMLVLSAGAVQLWRWRPPGARALHVRRAGLALALLLCAGYVQYVVRSTQGRWWSSIPRFAAERSESLVRWVSTSTAPGEIVGTNQGGSVYLYTGRRTMPVSSFSTEDHFRAPSVAEAEAALRAILAHRTPDVVVITPGTPKPAIDAVVGLAAGGQPALVLRDSFPLGYVFAPIPVIAAGRAMERGTSQR